ncbi:hypothetical protein ASPZODRAFT_1948904 [Penicilliopsis zonata CBS 506.65]|uniref:Uncharacterized protein n=1 Tax=Penicilliopsis zonata CBS 506.65 TaxID=1073090 RepID=A0A1L9SGM0_9EURO|nr:hypothetical protein ASPZODRAFT_1948904 [Penicilliopsis zonata CBS 506.65]OJJ46329.1 hypothetical protein ASPZODRAFT_1948904 [Penicilliopsis zonata CBS 506.65]
MSLIDHTLHDLDAQFNHIYLSILKTCNQEATLSLSQPKIQSLNWTHYQKLIDGLSYTYKRHPILSSETLLDILSQVNHLHDDSSLSSQYLSSHESELLWLISAKATAHSIGLAVHSLLDQALEISNEIWYWDEVLGSFWYTGLYSIQTSPSRIWKYIVQGYPSWTGRPSTAPASTLLMSIRYG